MKSYELMPTKENIIKTFSQNLLDRNRDVFRFADILNSLEDNCSIAIDGSWGSGKTFFVNQVKMFLGANNAVVCSLSEDEKTTIINEWKKIHIDSNPEYQTIVSVYYDAWENDNDEDPVLSLVYTILKQVDEDFSTISNSDFVDSAANILEFFTEKNWSSLIKAFRGDDPLDKLRKEKAVQDEVKTFLDTLLIERGNRLVIFVDELDRCKPSYAVRLLERIKHYFSNEKITFVFSVNTNELQHTIKHYYGNEFDACRYLDRFFDLRISLPPANMDKFYYSINFNRTQYLYDVMCQKVITKNNFSIRETAKYIRLAKIAAHKPTHDGSMFSFSDGRANSFCLYYIVPIALGLKVSKIERYLDFIEGRDPTPLFEYIDIGQELFERFLFDNESYNPEYKEGNIVTIQKKLSEVYEALFVADYSGVRYQTTIGKCEFSQNTKELFLRVISLLSKYTSVDVD